MLDNGWPTEPPVPVDPREGFRLWELTENERRIYEAGFMDGYSSRNLEVDSLNYEADRLYRAAFDHRNCSCWKRGPHGR